MVFRRRIKRCKGGSGRSNIAAERKCILLHPLLGLMLAMIAIASLASAVPQSPEAWSGIKVQLRLTPAEPPQTPLFGLAEYLAALALLFITLTISDFRYRLRLNLSAFDMVRISFMMSFAIGFLILCIDAWFINRWPVPQILKSSNNLKLILALIFLTMTCYLSYIAFISPPKFSKWNARKVFNVLRYYVARGSTEQLTAIADWMTSSAERIIYFATERSSNSASRVGEAPLSYADFAAYTLLLLGDKKLCRQMVETSPWTIAEFFNCAGQHPHAGLPLSQFASNIGTELVVNPRSALYVEDDGYTSGFLGFTKPITRSVFGNFDLVEALASSGRSPLDIDVGASLDLNPAQLDAYARGVLIFSRSYFEQRYPHHSYGFTRALSIFERTHGSLTALGVMGDRYWQSDEYRKLEASIRFIRDLVKLLSEYPAPRKRRKRDYQLDGLEHVHHQIADLIFEIITDASRLRAPVDTCWAVKHNAIWSNLFGFEADTSSRLVAFYLRRRMYDEIIRMDNYTNFVGAGIIGYCLNIFGVSVEELARRDRYGFAPLQRAAVGWVKRNYLTLYEEYPAVAEAILVGGISFDPKNKRLIKSYASLLGKPPTQRYLQLTSNPDATTAAP